MNNKKYQIYFLATGLLLIIVSVGEYFGQSILKLTTNGNLATLVNFSSENIIFLVHIFAGIISVFFYIMLQKKNRYAVFLFEKVGIFLFIFYLILFYIIDPILHSVGFAPM